MKRYTNWRLLYYFTIWYDCNFPAADLVICVNVPSICSSLLPDNGGDDVSVYLTYCRNPLAVLIPFIQHVILPQKTVGRNGDLSVD